MGDALACVFSTVGLYVERRRMKKAMGNLLLFIYLFLKRREDSGAKKRGGFCERTSVTGRVREVETL